MVDGNRRPRVALIGAQNPFANHGGASLRLRQMMEVMRRIADVRFWGIGESDESVPDDCRLHVVRPWHTLNRIQRVLAAARFVDLSHDPYTTFLYRRRWAKDLEQFVKRFQPDLLVVSEPWTFRYIERLRRACPDSPIVYDMHNVEVMLRASVAGIEEAGWRARLEVLRSRLIGRHERELIRWSRTVWCCSSVDAERVRDVYAPHAPIHVIPNAIDPPEGRPAKAGSHVLSMVGLYSYAPNEDAALELLRDIFPLIQAEFPDAQLRLIGRNPTAAMHAAAEGMQGVTITGEVASIPAALEGTETAIIPLRAGGGTRLKVLEAMAMNIPIVATPIAVEGIDLEHETSAWLVDGAAALADGVVALWREPTKAAQMVAKANALFHDGYSWKAVAERVAHAVNASVD